MKLSPARRNIVALVILLTVLLLVCVPLASLTARQGGADQDSGKKKKIFTDEDLKVEKINGRWRVQCMYDAKQLNDHSVPVYVKEINMFWGIGKYLGRVKVPEVTLENRGSRQTQVVQLKWAIVKVEEPDIILLDGDTPFFDAQINPHSAARLDIPEIYFNKILKPLIKDDELNGYFRLVVGVKEVRFSDGERWQAAGHVALLRSSYLKKSSSLRPRYRGVSLRAGPPPNAVSAWRLELTSCGECGPGMFAPALFTSLQITDPPCRENRACGWD